MDKSVKELAKNLAKLMEREDWSRAGLHSKTKLARDTLNDYLNGNANPRLASIDKLAKALNVETWELLKPEAELLTPVKREIIRLLSLSAIKDGELEVVFDWLTSRAAMIDKPTKKDRDTG